MATRVGMEPVIVKKQEPEEAPAPEVEEAPTEKKVVTKKSKKTE